MKTTHTPEKNRFDLYDDAGKHVGEIEYRITSKTEYAATHTEVFPGNEGKGYAAVLLDALCKYAEANDIKIKAVCPYVVARFEKDPVKYAAVIPT